MISSICIVIVIMIIITNIVTIVIVIVIVIVIIIISIVIISIVIIVIIMEEVAASLRSGEPLSFKVHAGMSIVHVRVCYHFNNLRFINSQKSTLFWTSVYEAPIIVL